jgi:hypothetical protein
MEVRRRALPAGWYPASARDCRREIEDYLRAGRVLGAERGRLLASYTSADVVPYGESFVGYAAITF